MQREMKTLHLTLKKRWFDMIQSGEKCEEYREIKNYWFRRIYGLYITDPGSGKLHTDDAVYATLSQNHNLIMSKHPPIQFARVTFRNGYGRFVPEMTFPIESITIGEGRPEWGAEPGKKYFIIKFKHEKVWI